MVVSCIPANLQSILQYEYIHLFQHNLRDFRFIFTFFVDNTGFEPGTIRGSAIFNIDTIWR